MLDSFTLLRSSPGSASAKRFPGYPAMAVNRPFEELQARLAEFLEASPAKDIQRNAKAFLNSAFGRLDLVTREEFDIQAKLLARALERLAALEARVAALEANAGREANANREANGGADAAPPPPDAAP